jgi:hypothetical protein
MTVVVYTGFIKETLLPVAEGPDQTVVPELPPPVIIDVSSPNPIAIIAVLVTIAFIGLSIYMFIKIPKTIVKTGNKVVHTSAETVAPVVMRIQHIDEPARHPKKLKFLTGRLVIIMKMVIIIIPLTISLCAQLAGQTTVDFNIVVNASLWLAGLAIVFFVVQYSLAKVLSVKQEDLL